MPARKKTQIPKYHVNVKSRRKDHDIRKTSKENIKRLMEAIRDTSNSIYLLKPKDHWKCLTKAWVNATSEPNKVLPLKNLVKQFCAQFDIEGGDSLKFSEWKDKNPKYDPTSFSFDENITLNEKDSDDKTDEPDINQDDNPNFEDALTLSFGNDDDNDDDNNSNSQTSEDVISANKSNEQLSKPPAEGVTTQEQQQHIVQQQRQNEVQQQQQNGDHLLLPLNNLPPPQEVNEKRQKLLLDFLHFATTHTSKFLSIANKYGETAVQAIKQNLVGEFLKFVLYHRFPFTPQITGLFGLIWGLNDNSLILAKLNQISNMYKTFLIEKGYVSDLGIPIKDFQIKLNENFGINLNQPTIQDSSLYPSPHIDQNSQQPTSLPQIPPPAYTKPPPQKKRRLDMFGTSVHNPSWHQPINTTFPLNQPMRHQPYQNAHSILEKPSRHQIFHMIQQELSNKNPQNFMEIFDNPAISNMIQQHYNQKPISEQPTSMQFNHFTNQQQSQNPPINIPPKSSIDTNILQSFQQQLDNLQHQLRTRIPSPTFRTNPNLRRLNDIYTKPVRGLYELATDYDMMEATIKRMKLVTQSITPDDHLQKLNKLMNSATNKEVVNHLQGLPTIHLAISNRDCHLYFSLEYVFTKHCKKQSEYV